MRSARNREPLSLAPVALLLTAGFAADFAQENARLSNPSPIYGAYFLAVCRATHIYPRVRLPAACCSKLLATGLTAVFAIQAFPLTGVTPAFVGYAGSSIVANFVSLALLALISDRARRETGAPGRTALALEAA